MLKMVKANIDEINAKAHILEIIKRLMYQVKKDK